MESLYGLCEYGISVYTVRLLIEKNITPEELLVNAEEILSADHVVLPGVGSFGDAMSKLNEYGLVEVINKVVVKQIPFLGICLGYQLMFEESEEVELQADEEE